MFSIAFFVLSSASAGVPPAMVTSQQLRQNPYAMAGASTAFAGRDEQDEMQLVLCTECTKHYESEASLVKAEADAEAPRASLPDWLVLGRPPAAETPHKRYLIELKRKWSRLCRKLHLCSDPSSPCPWWSGSCLLPASKSKPSVAGFLGLDGLMEQRKNMTGRWSPPSPSRGPPWGLSPPTMGPGCQGVATTLALGSHPLSDSATSNSRAPGSGDGSAAAVRELEQRLRRNIPWQPGAVVAEIAKAVVASRRRESDGVMGAWLYVKGSDHSATRRAVTVIAETCCGSADRVICADASKFSCAEELCSDVVSRASEMGGRMLVVIVDDVENASCDVADRLVAASKSGSLKDHQSGQVLDLSGCIVILTASKLPGGDSDQIISLRLWSEDEASSGALKRKTESPQGEGKRALHDVGLGSLDLNLCAEDDPDEDEDDGAPSDITDEGDSSDSSEHGQPHGLLEALAASVVTLDKEGGGGGDATASIRARLARAIGQGGTGTRVEETAVQALATASGQFLEEELESWTAEVLERAVAVAAVKNGGKGKLIVLGLGPGGGVRETAGFMGSVLPSRVQVD